MNNILFEILTVLGTIYYCLKVSKIIRIFLLFEVWNNLWTIYFRLKYQKQLKCYCFEVVNIGWTNVLLFWKYQKPFTYFVNYLLLCVISETTFIWSIKHTKNNLHFIEVLETMLTVLLLEYLIKYFMSKLPLLESIRNSVMITFVWNMK